jgi:hypothetical protein
VISFYSVLLERATDGPRSEVIFHEDFYDVDTTDPAAEAGRMEAVIDVIRPHAELKDAEPALALIQSLSGA